MNTHDQKPDEAASVLQRLTEALVSTDIVSIDAALAQGRHALDAADSAQRATLANHLARVLAHRFTHSAMPADLDDAVAMQRNALALNTTGRVAQARYQSNLANMLRMRFELSGSAEDLDEAIDLAHSAIALTPDDDPDLPGYESNLCGALQRRFEQLNQPSDLNEAIEVARRAVSAVALDDPDRAAINSNLGIALHVRFLHSRSGADLDEAIAIGRQVLAATDTEHVYRAMFLSNALGALQRRFDYTGQRADLDEAVQLGHELLATLPPKHPGRGMYLSNLGNTYRVRYERTQAESDLDEAVRLGEQALDATPDNHPGRAMYLSNLGAALGLRYSLTGQQADLDEAVRVGRQAEQLTPRDHPDRVNHLYNLGLTLSTRFDRTAATSDRDEAVALFEKAIQTHAAPTMRIRAAHAQARLLRTSEPSRAAELLAQAVRLLPETAGRQLARTDQQYALAALAGITADAAALALDNPSTTDSERAGTALRLLEAGRTVLLSQALDLRRDITGLRDRTLAARFIAVRDRRDQIPDPRSLSPITDEHAFAAATLGDHERRRLTAELDELLPRIRAFHGFEDFGRLPTRDQLRAEAAHGPVVTINISRYRCDALLLTPEGVTSIPLPGLTSELVDQRAQAFHDALSALRRAANLPEQRNEQRRLSTILEWLWDEVAGPVLEALGCRQPLTTDSPPPRIWWIPGGLLGLLPIHAAGYHTKNPDPDRRTVMDRVISSYTPSITALRHARQRQSGTAHETPTRALIVTMPTTPGEFQELRWASAEAHLVAGLLPDSVLLTEPTPENLGSTAAVTIPTKNNVLEQLRTSAIAHFACHGISDPVRPHRSCLFLHDHLTDPLTVEALSLVQLDHGRLAYLSACETALIRDAALIDEAIHLAAAFQLVGYPHVIGTLWTVNDKISEQIARKFYGGLTATAAGDKAVATAHAAHALHSAVRTVRDKFPRDPALWAAYLHTGA